MGVECLAGLGLSRLEARVYFALLGGGVLDAASLAKNSGVCRSDVYRVLRRLEGLGLVERLLCYPCRFSAVPLRTAIDVLVERRDSELRELKSKLAALLSEYEPESGAASPEEPGFLLVPSQKRLLNRLEWAIKSCTASIEVATSSQRFISACMIFSDALESAWARGVKGRVVIEAVEEPVLDAARKVWRRPHAEIRYLPRPPRTVMAMYDRREVFVFAEKTAELQDSPALWSNNPNLAAVAQDYYEILWITANEAPHHPTEEAQP